MKNFSFFIFLICSSGISAQVNLVQNYSFEDVTGTLECYAGPTPNFPNATTHGQEALEDYWAELPPWTVPEMGAGNQGAGSSDHFCDGGNTGSNYGEGTNREYICAPLSAGLVTGHRYYIEFYVKSSSTLADAGLRFSTDRPKQTGYLRINIDGQPHFEIDNGLTFSWNSWTKVSGYYTPDNDYTWMTIGTFDREKDYESTFAIDDIKIVEWVDDCPAIQLLENWNFNGFTGITISAADKLFAGYDVGAVSPNGNVTVPAGAGISFKAGSEVGLLNGFSAETGSQFRAYNAPCGSDCFTPAPVAGSAAVICDGQPYHLGGSSVAGYTYSWQSIPQNGINYLSSTTVSDPVFTAPPGSGTITFYVNAINTCGQSGANSVTIHYDDTPSAVAQFSLANVQMGDVPSFDVLLNPDIQSVTIEILDNTLTNTYYQETFADQVDFQCCNLFWTNPVSLSACSDYKIRVTVINYCTGATAIQVVDWIRNRTFSTTAPIPNIITPNGNGINDFFCVDFTGATSASLEVKASSGVTIYLNTTSVFAPQACLWNGECNQGLPSCVNGPVPDGTYFYILRFFDCNNAEYDYTGFITVLHDGNRMMQDEDSTAFPDNGLSVYPNPSNGIITITLPAVAGVQSILIITNAHGEIMLSDAPAQAMEEVHYDLQGLPAGMYFVHYSSGDKSYAEKFIVE